MVFVCMILSQILDMFPCQLSASMYNFRIFSKPQGSQIQEIQLLDLLPITNAWILFHKR